MNLLPKVEVDETIDFAFDKFSERNMKQLVFLVGNLDKSKAKNSAGQLVNSLQENKWVDTVVFGVNEQSQESIGQFTYQFRNFLLSESDKRLLEDKKYSSFSDFTIQQIYSPFSQGLIGLLEADPFLSSVRFGLERSQEDGSGFTLDDGYLVKNIGDMYYILVRAELSQSPFNQNLQKELISDFELLETQWGQNDIASHLYRTGALFYTEHAYRTARHEVGLIGGSSLLLVLILICFAFLSLRPLLLVTVALSFGISLGFVSVRLLFQEVHLLTIVFGASLIGVAVDYAFHYFAVEDCATGSQRLRRILPAISLGLLSSVIGYVALLSTPFPGLRQMAVFCIMGLIGAYLTVILLFPMIPLKNSCSPLLINICQKLLNLGAKNKAVLILKFVLFMPVIAIITVLTNDSPSNDIREFQALNEGLLLQETFIQTSLDSPATNQFYLVKGEDPQALLRNLESANEALDELVLQGELDGYLGISQWLPSIEKQQENHALYEELYDSDAYESLIDLGLKTEQDNILLKQNFKSTSNNYIEVSDWLASPISEQLSYLWLGDVGGSYAAVIGLRGLDNVAALRDISENIIFVDKVSTVSSMLDIYRQSALYLLLLATSLIFAVFIFRYGIRLSGIMILSPTVAMSAAIIGLAILGEPLSLFNVLALFLVLGVGVDFSIFFAESLKASPNTLLAIFMSALTTIFSFGLLSLSSTTIIHSIGLTMLIGIGVAFILSPIVGNLVTNLREVK